jgi:hypothetical protein
MNNKIHTIINKDSSVSPPL